MKSHQARLRRVLRKSKLDAFLITSGANLQYLTGFETSWPTKREGYGLIDQDHTWLLTDGRYFERAEKLPQVKAVLMETKQTLIKFLKDKVNQHQWQQLGLEKDHITLAEYMDLKQNLRIKIVPTRNMIEKLREVKSKTELAFITKATQLTDQVFVKLCSTIKPGMSEHEVEALIRSLTAQVGGDGQAFTPIVAAGKHSSVPHHLNTNYRFQNNDLVLIDFGVKYSGYCADMTRMIFFSPPTPKQKKIYHLILKAQETVLKEVRPGITGEEVDAIARDFLASHGFDKKLFPHSLGHSVGIDIHDGFNLSPGSKVVLKPAMVFSVEPGIYLPGEFGIRIENLVVTKAKGVRSLTQTPQDLVVLN